MHGDRDVDTVCISCVLRKVFVMRRDGGGRARCHDQILTVAFESADMRAIAPVCVCGTIILVVVIMCLGDSCNDRVCTKSTASFQRQPMMTRMIFGWGEEESVSHGLCK